MDGETCSAYDAAILMLMNGRMPIIVDVPDGMHVLSIIPVDRASVAAMINPSQDERAKFVVESVVAVKNHLLENSA